MDNSHAALIAALYVYLALLQPRDLDCWYNRLLWAGAVFFALLAAGR